MIGFQDRAKKDESKRTRKENRKRVAWHALILLPLMANRLSLSAEREPRGHAKAAAAITIGGSTRLGGGNGGQQVLATG